MKKIYTIAFLLLGLPHLTHSQCNTTFYDGFESGTYSPTWSSGSAVSTVSVTSAYAASGTYSLELTGGSSNHFNGMSTTITAAYPTYVSWNMYPSGSLSNNYIVMGDNSIGTTDCMVFCYWKGSDGNIRFVNSSSNLDVTVTPDQWHHVELMNIDWINLTFDVYVDNVLQTTAFEFRATSMDGITNIHLYNFDDSPAHWDNILLGDAPVNISSSISDASCFDGDDGSIDIEVTSGTPTYTFDWSNGSTTEDVTNLTAGVYSLTITDANGCSLDTNITVGEPAEITNSITTVSCGEYEWNGQIYSQSGQFMQVLSSTNGCDSTVNMDLTVYDFDLSVTQNGGTFSSNQASATYQWLNCNNGYSEISGATHQSYTPTSNGSYAVVVTTSNCSDTSACYTIDNVGINNSTVDLNQNVYPNPSHGEFFINSNLKEYQINIYNVTGQKVNAQINVTNQNTTIDLSKYENGIYYLELIDNNLEVKTLKIIKF